MRLAIKKKADEIISFAEKNGKSIRHNLIVDLLCDKDDTVSDADMKAVLGLLEKNKIVVEDESDEDYQADSTDPKDYIPKDVNINQRPINVYNLMERLENGEIDLTPGFQRHGGLWTEEQQSRLIESLMLKIPIPAFYFNASNDENWIVIDGLQRLTSFYNFLIQKNKFVGMQYFKEFDNKTFDELPRQYVRRIKESALIAYTVEKGTPDTVVYNIFQRINTGGLQLNSQEIRQALYMGAGTKLIQKLAESEEFLTATQYAISSKRMADREYVTRFIAFTELDYTLEYKGNIDQFLIKAIKLVNNYDRDKQDEVEKHFKQVMVFCSEVFGKYAFRKYNRNWRRGPINKALFELWSICFSELSENQREGIKRRKTEFLEKFGELLQDGDFVTVLKSGDQYSTVRRIEIAHKFLKEFV